MIEFITLFLGGLGAGPRPVEIMAGDDVAIVEVWLDGELEERLDADDPRAIRLPPFDPHQTHYLRVRLEFSEAVFSESEAVFGGVYGNEISTEISAVPIRFEKGRRPKSAQAMGEWFTVGGVPLTVHAVEKGLAEIVVVRDIATQKRLARLAALADQLGADRHLKHDHRISFINPCAEVHPRDGFRQFVYPRTQRNSSDHGTLLKILVGVIPANCSEQEQHLADAVGTAGLSASEDGLRRVVLLLIAGEPQDQSAFTPAQGVAFLEKLRVPLVIWNLGSPDGPETTWVQATNVRKLGRLDKAFTVLAKDLEHQLIVWLEGLHLPQSVELRPNIEGITLVQ